MLETKGRKAPQHPVVCSCLIAMIVKFKPPAVETVECTTTSTLCELIASEERCIEAQARSIVSGVFGRVRTSFAAFSLAKEANYLSLHIC